MRNASFWLVVASMFAMANIPIGAQAWGRTGHLLVSRVAAETLPDSVPAFVRTAAAIEEIAQLGPEADNVKGAGKTRDDDENSAHFVDIADDGTIFGIVPLTSLPIDRLAYDSALRKGGSDQYKAGYLPYSLIDGFQLVRQDFAYWRAASALAKRANDPATRSYFEAQRALRETLTLRDIGFWGHFVGDASQPLHATMHYDGWEERYPGSKGLHARFESAYVRANVNHDMVRSRVAAFTPCNCTIDERVRTYLAGSLAQVIPTYELFKRGSFATPTTEGTAFAADRIAIGAAQFRDMIAEAWLASADATVGYPPVKVRDIEAGTIAATPTIFGDE